MTIGKLQTKITDKSSSETRHAGSPGSLDRRETDVVVRSRCTKCNWDVSDVSDVTDTPISNDRGAFTRSPHAYFSACIRIGASRPREVYRGKIVYVTGNLVGIVA